MIEQIEAIRAEIERRKKKYLFDDQPMTIGRYYEDRDLLSFIDSLPEEPAPKGYDEAYLNECIAKASKTWEGVDVDKYVDEVRGNRPMNSDNSLEDEMINYWGRIPDDKDLNDTARHFALWQKEQMMKDAVEGLICATITGTAAISFLSSLPKELTAGDKVRIIIVKED